MTSNSIRDAASVILLRDGTSGLEVFVQQRVKGMAFAAGMTVFPGGRADVSDGALDIGWSGPDPTWWAEQWSTDTATARTLVLAAVRETFEECGVLLAGTSPLAASAPTEGDATIRVMLERHELSFADYLRRDSLIVLSGLLKPWSNWITPVTEPRRYDTRFFVAELPDGQIADGATTEADGAHWIRPQDAITSWVEGRSMLLPPTWAQLHSLLEFDSVSSVMESERAVKTVVTEVVDDVGAGPLSFPGSEMYVSSGATLPWHR